MLDIGAAIGLPIAAVSEAAAHGTTTWWTNLFVILELLLCIALWLLIGYFRLPQS